MVEQFQSDGIEPPRTVFVTAATGNTVAGFLVGEHALRARGHRPIRIVGVQVYPGSVRLSTWAMIQWTRRFAGLRVRVPLRSIEIDSSALLGGFGRFSEELSSTCDRVAGEFGLAIDPIFGGKTWHTMERYRALGLAEDPVLFWHCGFTPEWRTLASRISDPQAAA
jgi:1-aminocyclopropane-1-carboxylate deaminase/D-cysteine desulfhydrase-like pyridoxal-dependent ACC family enzyme